METSEIIFLLPNTGFAVCIRQFVLNDARVKGVKLIFFSDGHLAPKFFKVVANSKKVGRHFQRQTKPFFTLSGL